MKAEDVDENKRQRGEYCRKQEPGCFCAVGFPYEFMCPNCRDGRTPSHHDIYCICPPVPRIFSRD